MLKYLLIICSLVIAQRNQTIFENQTILPEDTLVSGVYQFLETKDDGFLSIQLQCSDSGIAKIDQLNSLDGLNYAKPLGLDWLAERLRPTDTLLIYSPKTPLSRFVKYRIIEHSGMDSLVCTMKVFY